MTYVIPQITADRATVKQEMVDELQARFPGLEVLPNTLLDGVLDVIASRDAQLLEVLTDRLAGTFTFYGRDIVRVPPAEATRAASTITITAADSLGHTLAAGAELTLAGGAGERVAFQTMQDAAIGAGQTMVAAVPIVALEPGDIGTGLQADAQLEQPLAWVESVTVDAPTTGGADGDDEDAYRDRLAEEMQLLGRTLTTPRRFAIAARTDPGVGRAMAIDLYDASTSTASVGGHITVAVVAANGQAVGTTVRDRVRGRLVEDAVSDLTVHVVDPAYTPLTVAFAGKAHPGHDPAAVEAAAEQAVLDFLSPARWGTPPSGDRVGWVDQPKVRYQDVVTALNNVEGFDYYTSLTVNGGTSDVTLTGPAGLPAPAPTTTVTGTVT